MLPGLHRNTWIEIDRSAIAANIKNERNVLPNHVAIWAVVKANAYGHGMIEVAKVAQQSGATGFCVAFLDEALALRKAGFKTEPILVLGATRIEDVELAAEENISLTTFSNEWLSQIKSSQLLHIHLKVDSGMGRLGVRSKKEVAETLQIIDQNKQLELEGIFTHFATADQQDTSYFNEQITTFEDILASLSTRPRYVHVANSATALLHDQSAFNVVRFGIAMYGLSPSPEIHDLLPFKLQPALSLYTEMVQVKQIHPGDHVSYGATYEANKEEWVATLPIGYADGWLRHYQGFEVLVCGKRVPIIGRVCMDQMMIKLPEYYPPGTKVILIGQSGGNQVTADDCAQYLDTINYEITCLLSDRVPRRYI